MKQTTTTQRKSPGQQYLRLYGLILMFLLAGIFGLQAQSVSWGLYPKLTPTTLTALDDPGELDVYFTPTVANITNAKVEVKLPANITYVSTENGPGHTASATYATPVVTGAVATGQTITISFGSALVVGNPIALKLKVTAGCAAVSGAEATIKVMSNATTVTSGQATVQIGVQVPVIRVTCDAPTQTYANQGDTKDFELKLDAQNGLAASLKLTLTGDKYTTMEDFFFDGTSITPTSNQITGGNRVVVIDLNNIPGKLGTTAKILKFTAGNTRCGAHNITTSAQYPSGSNCSTRTGAALTMSFTSVPGVPSMTLVSSGFVENDFNTSVSLYDVCQDGVTTTFLKMVYKNVGSADAGEIRHEFDSNTGSGGMYNYIDIDNIYYSVDGGTTRIKATSSQITTLTTLSDDIYRKLKNGIAGKTRSVRLTIEDILPIGQEVVFYYPIAGGNIYDNSTMTASNVRTSSHCFLNYYWYDISAYNLCGIQGSKPEAFYKSGLSVPFFTEQATPVSIRPGQTGETSFLLNTGVLNVANGISTDVYVQLPSWLDLDGSLATAFYFDAFPIVATVDDAINKIYKIHLTGTLSSSVNRIHLKYKATSTCPNPINENKTAQIVYWMDWNMGTPVTACNPVLKKIALNFQDATLLCKQDGVTLDVFNIKRTTKGLRDSDDNKMADDGSPALDSEIDHFYFVQLDKGVVNYEMTIVGNPGDTYNYLYTLLSSEMTLDANVTLEAGTISVKGGAPTPVTFTKKSSTEYFLEYNASSSPLVPGDKVIITLPFQTKAAPNMAKAFTGECYVTNSAIPAASVFNPTATLRHGEDEYSTAISVHTEGYFLETSGASFLFTNQTKQNNKTFGDFHNFHVNNIYTPYFKNEVRQLTQLQKVEFTVPSGYVLGQTLSLNSDQGGTLQFTNPTITTTGGKTTYSYDITPVFDAGNESTGAPAAGMWVYPDDKFVYKPTLNFIQATKGAPSSGQLVINYVYFRSQTGTVSNTSRGFNLSYTGTATSLTTSTNTLAAYGPNMSVPVVTVGNPSTVSINNTWLYVTGNVTNLKLKNGAATVASGTGFEGRWIKVSDVMAPGQTYSYKLDFTYGGGTSCDSENITIYTVSGYETTWDPTSVNSAALDITDVNHVGATQTVAITSAPAAITGSLGTSTQTLIFNTSYTVTAVLDSRTSEGSIKDAQMEITIPAGQKYMDNTAKIEYPKGSTPVAVPAAMELLLRDANTNLAVTRTITFKAAGLLPGYKADGVTDNDCQMILTADYAPQCETPLTGINYSGVLTGKTSCGLTASGNGLNVFNPSMYSNISSSYTFDVTTEMKSGNKAFNEKQKNDILKVTIKKTSGAGINMATTDLLMVEMPKEFNINGTASITSGLGTGAVTTSKNDDSGTSRILNLSLPITAINADASKGMGQDIVYEIPVVYTPNGQTLAPNPIQKMKVDVVTNKKFAPTCPDAPLSIGNMSLDIAVLTANSNAYMACLNTVSTPEITSANFAGSWYDNINLTGTALSTTAIYSHTPTTMTNKTYYVSAIFNSVDYGKVPVEVNMNPSISMSATNPAAICVGGNTNLAASGVVSVTTASTYSTKYYRDAACTDELLSTTVNPTVTTTYYAQATTAEGCKTSATAIVVTVLQTPTMTAPVDQTFNASASTTAIALSGSNATGFSWTGGSTIGLADGSNATQIPSFTAVNAGFTPVTRQITVTPTNGSCPGTAVTFDITVNASVLGGTIADVGLCAGANCAAITPTGAQNVAYYTWTGGSSLGLADGTGITNTSITAFTAASVATTTTNVITVIPYNASNVAGSAITFNLTVNALPTVSVSHNQTPAGACLNTDVVFTTQTGTNYVWTVDGATITAGATATSNTATLQWATAGTKTVTVNYKNSNGCQAATSSQATISINTKPAVAPITLPAAVCEGTALTLPSPTVTAQGTPLTTQTWKLNNVAYTAGRLLTYADNGKSLTFTASSACGDSIVTVGNITVNAKPTVAPITLPAAICEGSALTLPTPTVAARGTAITAQTWKLAGTAYTAGTVLTYADNGKSLTFTASSACGDSVVTVGNITVYQTTAINTQPSVPTGIKLSNGYIIPGSIVPLSVAAVGHNLTYQWYWKKASDGSTVTLSDNSKYTGSTTASLTINNAYETENGDYYVTVTGTCNTVTSTPVTIVAVANQDASLKDLKVNGSTLSDFNPGKTDYLLAISCDDEQVTILGTPNFAGVTSITGNGTFALQPGDNYFPITVVAQDMVTTRTYTVNVVRNCYVPKIKKDLDDAVICLNGTHTWTIEAEGENLTYEWYKGETRIMGQNAPSITFTDAKFSDYDRYYVVVRSNHNGFKSSIQSKKVRLWVADYLPEHLRLSEYPNPATVGKNYHLKVDGYVDVTKYSWSYSKSGVTFSPAVTLYNDNETWATFGSLSVGTGMLKVTMEHPCGTRELTQTITVNYPTGVDDVTATVVTVYPNPTSGLLKVSGTVSNQMIRVVDVTGSLKGSYKTQEGTTTIDLTGYAKGTYLVQYNGKAYKVIRK